MANTRHIETRYHLQRGAESLIVAYWTHDTFHVDNARDALTQALCGGDRDALEAMIAEAITNARITGCTDAKTAMWIVDDLLDYAVPLTAEKGDA